MDDLGIIRELVRNNIPFTTIHHFENERLNHPIVRLKLRKFKKIGLVSDINIPPYLKERSSQICEGIDIDFFKNKKKVPCKNNNNKIILLPARISPTKGQYDLVQAIHLINRDHFKVKVALAGLVDDEIFMTELNFLIRALNELEQVILLGDLDQSALRDWYEKCTIVVLPSYSEGLGRIILEAQAMKKPVIAYDVGGIPSAMINGETGYLVKKGDINSLAVCIFNLLNNDQKIKQMGEAGRKFVESKFNLKNMVESHENFYLSAIKLHTSAQKKAY
jgi:glycosyltransferase involved in cell wall biosynthesis